MRELSLIQTIENEKASLEPREFQIKRSTRNCPVTADEGKKTHKEKVA